MAVTSTERVYEGLSYTFHKGIDAEGGYVEYITEGKEYPNGLIGVFEPVIQNIHHVTGGKGKIAYLETYYQWYLQDSEGNMVEGTEPKRTHPLYGTLHVRTSPWDEKDFTMFFGPEVAKFRQNGFARAIMGQPKTNNVYLPDGTPREQTEEMKTQVRTNLYQYNDIAPADADTPNP